MFDITIEGKLVTKKIQKLNLIRKFSFIEKFIY